ncbi:tetratricopeptide repeat protein [Halomonas kalidii]|uniref:Tetratricopeptide repeat protein n=1 Tax=Halomonas kalidii TaxID=3043293 RepID=A0ABT6VQ84_9GAMM|nr:tetratricopeptide repeat protein [Halomonas kalidii]MDI5936149.1 tetratricopeptide repeat protein [Halomonas kalidii]
MPSALDTLPLCVRSCLAPLALTMLVAGCQALPTGSDNAQGDDPLAGAPPIERGLDAQGLSGLLTAELAGQRGDYRRATLGYLEGAERYGSVALVERAALAARFSNDPQLLTDTAELWRTLAPDSDAPTRLLASLALQRGDWPEALAQRLQVVARGGQGELTAFVELALGERADPAPLLELMRHHLARPGADEHPQHHDAELATALLEVAVGDTTSAQRRLDRLAERSPELPELWLAQARLAQESGDHTRAREAVRRGLTISPGDPRFVLMLAQSELRLGNIDAAEAQTDNLLESQADNQELRLALAQLYLEENHPEPARRLLLPLVGETDTPAQAFYLLGAIAEAEGEVDNALLYYRQVPPGDDFLPARLSAASMLIEDDRLIDARAFLRIERLRHETYFADLVSLEVELLERAGRSDDADALLDRELDRTPNDEQLLYLRAMRAWEAGDLEAMERDLGRVIERNPDNVTALNALGYTLADLGIEGRLEEAREMIERAHELEPDSPAIMDSLGWVHFRLGDPERALPWLERAYGAMPDQEIAAHLAEVLWALERRDEARALVREAIERFDARPLLDDLLERIPELSP